MEVSEKKKDLTFLEGYQKKNVSKFQGKHLLLELYGCNSEKLNDESFIRDKLNLAAKLAKAKVLNIVSHKFEPFGVTAIVLLAESHMSIHTWPESGYSAVDIFTCGREMKPYLASQFLLEKFEATNHYLKTVNREYPLTIEGNLRKF